MKTKRAMPPSEKQSPIDPFQTLSEQIDLMTSQIENLQLAQSNAFRQTPVSQAVRPIDCGLSRKKEGEGYVEKHDIDEKTAKNRAGTQAIFELVNAQNAAIAELRCNALCTTHIYESSFSLQKAQCVQKPWFNKKHGSHIAYFCTVFYKWKVVLKCR